MAKISNKKRYLLLDFALTCYQNNIINMAKKGKITKEELLLHSEIIRLMIEQKYQYYRLFI